MAIGSRTATAALHRRLSSAESLQSIRNSAIGLDDVPISVADQTGPITWMALPRKGQLAILFLCRFVDFLQVASLQAYAYYQLKSLNSTLSDAQVSIQAGILQGCFTGAQVLTAVLWGKAADTSWCGRKPVLVLGLAGTAVSCIGYGFATSFFWSAFWRIFGGGINGTVGIM
ncbi:major facilitator superfamily transporter multidrug resistance [Grosmannia clavigera kw1407]|uniref:Major facilitator superfamily transporter multidrug resistance n=1 Tax=Grosmannia clavigera (strain kw1407 / UAMH 11150) TaxID=655863 RepID=F0XSZ8_GROCL|nr:major facilitator superfamily transporter multidrug resistance [Grosmannia clavigera kw1407]EFW99276.1 major facilitator superfamily transporter multidrug resistance [Grosmannia clavigera kw1407]